MVGRIGDNGPAGTKGGAGSVISINGYVVKNACNWACERERERVSRQERLPLGL
jgi:hypothetical protein